MKHLLLGFFMALSMPVYAQKANSGSMQTSSELLEWCQVATQSHFVGKGQTPYNWAASWWEEGNVLFVKGSWRVDDQEVGVECRAVRGAKKTRATFRFENH